MKQHVKAITCNSVWFLVGGSYFDLLIVNVLGESSLLVSHDREVNILQIAKQKSGAHELRGETRMFLK